jgi:stress response protein YsnF
MIPLPKEAV